MEQLSQVTCQVLPHYDIRKMVTRKLLLIKQQNLLLKEYLKLQNTTLKKHMPNIENDKDNAS